MPYDAGKRFPAPAANYHAGEMEGLPHDLPEGRADFYRRLEEGGTTLEKILAGVYHKAGRVQI